MAQEQAKSGSAATGAKEQKPLDAMTRSRDDKSGEGLERGLELPKRTSLAERLKAEQRKREGIVEPKREEPPKPPEETVAAETPAGIRRGAGPERRAHAATSIRAHQAPRRPSPAAPPRHAGQ